MSPSRPIVPRGYGDEHFETRETSGGLSGAVVDVARLLAAMNAKPYTPLGRPAVESLLAHAAVTGATRAWLRLARAASTRRMGAIAGPRAGSLQTSQSGALVRDRRALHGRRLERAAHRAEPDPGRRRWRRLVPALRSGPQRRRRPELARARTCSRATAWRPCQRPSPTGAGARSARACSTGQAHQTAARLAAPMTAPPAPTIG